MRAAIWGTRSSGDALAAMLRPRASCTVTPWSHGSIYRVTASWIELPWHALRERWRRRWQRLDYGQCPACEHQWTTHVGMTDPELDACDECLYELSHELPTKLTTPCQALAPQPPLP